MNILGDAVLAGGFLLLTTITQQLVMDGNAIKSSDEYDAVTNATPSEKHV